MPLSHQLSLYKFVGLHTGRTAIKMTFFCMTPCLFCYFYFIVVQLLVTSSPSHGLPKSTQNMKEIELINKIAKQNDVHKKRVIAYPVSAPAKHTNIKTKKIKMMKENQRKLQKRINSENKLEKIIVDELHKESIRKVKHDTKDAINQIANIHQETDAINRKRELLELLQNMIKMHLQTTEPPTPAPTVKFSETIPMLINITGLACSMLKLLFAQLDILIWYYQLLHLCGKVDRAFDYIARSCN